LSQSVIVSVLIHKIRFLSHMEPFELLTYCNLEDHILEEKQTAHADFLGVRYLKWITLITLMKTFQNLKNIAHLGRHSRIWQMSFLHFNQGQWPLMEAAVNH